MRVVFRHVGLVALRALLVIADLHRPNSALYLRAACRPGPSRHAKR